MTDACSNHYEIGQSYRDTGKPDNHNDQFMRWINVRGSGMANSPGIRPLSYLAPSALRTDLPAFVVLVTTEASGKGSHNPWEDEVHTRSGSIRYWGDAKFHPTKRQDDFAGNKVLRRIYDAKLEGRWRELPPILHFTKPKKGAVVFNGLCVLDRLELDAFEDKGHPIRNYRCSLRILDIFEVPVAWLHARREAASLAELDPAAPVQWREYTKGKHPRTLKVWGKRIRTKDQQMPPPASKALVCWPRSGRWIHSSLRALSWTCSAGWISRTP